jgi:hypothetical protein
MDAWDADWKCEAQMNQPLRRVLWVVFACVLLAGLVVIGLPPLIRSRINAGLADMQEGYVGHVDLVSIDWLTPGVTLHELRIERPQHKPGAPFMVVKRLEVAILFRSLFEPRVGLRFVEPVMTFIDARKPAQQQWGPPFNPANLREKLPFDLGAVQIADMEVHFRNFEARPKIDAYVHKVQVTASPLDNCIKNHPQGCDARADIKGRLMAGAGLRGQVQMSYDLKFLLDGFANLRNLTLSQLNPVLTRYAELDIQRGSLDLNMRMRGPRYHFTLLPDVENLDLLGGERDKTRPGRELMLGMLSGMIERRAERWSIMIDGTKGKDDLKWDLQRRPSKPPTASDVALP